MINAISLFIGVVIGAVGIVSTNAQDTAAYFGAVRSLASTGTLTNATCSIAADPAISNASGAPIVLTFTTSNVFAKMEFDGHEVKNGEKVTVYPTDETTYTVLINGTPACMYTVQIEKASQAAVCDVRDDLTYGTSNDQVGTVQQVLIDHGFPIVKTNAYDDRTKAAVKLFQIEKVATAQDDLRKVVTGVWDERTRSAIHRLYGCGKEAVGGTPQAEGEAVQEDSTRALCIEGEYTVGSRGDSVTRIQKFLIAEDYRKVEATGYYGEMTRRAVKHFQETYTDDILAPAGLSVSRGVWNNATTLKASEKGLCEL